MTTKDAIKNFLLKLKAMDETAIPEEVVDAACEMAEEASNATDEEIKEEEKEEVFSNDAETESFEELVEKKAADAVSRALRAYGIKDACTNALDELEEELEKTETDDEDGEESVTVEADKVDTKDTAEELKKAIRDVKPALAAIKDPVARKKATDAFIKMARMNMNTTTSYADIQKGIADNAKKAKDGMVCTTSADYDHGMEIAKKYNPHYMTKEG